VKNLGAFYDPWEPYLFFLQSTSEKVLEIDGKITKE
jgi:hypothetical protein